MLLNRGEDPELRSTFTRRALLFGGVQAAALVGLGARLYKLQIDDADRYRALADANRLTSFRTLPERGRILDRFGAVLADNVSVNRLVLVPYRAGDVGKVLASLHAIVSFSDDDADRILLLARRQSPHIPILVANGLNWAQVARVNMLAPQLPGLETETGLERRYHHGTTVGHVVGHIGRPDKTAVASDPALRIPGIRTGRTGVELGMEQRLRGEPGMVKLRIDSKARSTEIAEEIASRSGRDAVLTIDLAMQTRAQTLLARERRAALVALDAQTGDIVAMASQPAFDNTRLAGTIGTRHWLSLRAGRDDPLINRAIRGAYPPGSTFKMVTALAGLESGEITPSTKLECWGSYSFQDQTYGCWRQSSGHGIVNLHRAIRESCDCYFYEVARRVGIARLAATARQLGFGAVFDCGIAGELAGVVPDNDWKIANRGKRWYPGETILAGIGQGYLAVTPLQLAVMTARIASGRIIVPNLLRPDPGERPFESAPLTLSSASLDVVRRGMTAAVNEDGGTAASAALDLGNVLLAGKTGTAQVSSLSHTIKNDELPWHKRDHGLFVGFAPATNPRYAVAAIVEHGSSGAKSAAPIVRDMMRELLSADPLARPAHVLGSDTAAPAGRRS